MCEGLKCFAQIVTLIFSQPLQVIVRKNVGARTSFETVQIKHLFILFQRANIRGSSIKCVHKIIRKTNISNPLILTRTCAYQGGGGTNVSFSENFAHVLNGWLLDLLRNENANVLSTLVNTSVFLWNLWNFEEHLFFQNTSGRCFCTHVKTNRRLICSAN